MSTSTSDVRMFYDRPRDVLYLTFGEKVPCISVEDPEIEGLHYRYSMADRHLAGITIVWFSLQDKSKLMQKLPFYVPLP